MKKPHTTTILLTTLLTASVIGNAVQYTTGKADPVTVTKVENQAAQDDILPEVPGEAATELTSWPVSATFAITYQVKEQAGTPGGATVTTYVKDAAPRVIKARARPTDKNVTWRPLPEGLPGVISQEVHSIEVKSPRAER